jgi:type I restriction enzyme R subunit
VTFLILSKNVTKQDETNPWLISTLIHKFGNRSENELPEAGNKKTTKSIEQYLLEVQEKLPKDFSAKGNIYVLNGFCI